MCLSVVVVLHYLVCSMTKPLGVAILVLLGLFLGAPPASAQAPACFPECRPGFLCHNGQCVSACNPPCAANEICTPQATCVSVCNPACPAGQACAAGGRCVVAAPVPAYSAPYGVAPISAVPIVPDPGWARGAARFGYISAAVILGLTFGVMSLNDSDPDASRAVGIAATLYAATAGPIVANGGGSARRHPQVQGSPGLRVTAWVGYAVTIIDALALIAVSFESEVSNGHVFSVGLLGALSTVGFALDAATSAEQADALRLQMGIAGTPAFAPTLGFARTADERLAPTLAWRATF